MTTDTQWIQFLEETHKIAKVIWEKRKLSFDKDFLYIPYFAPSGDLLFTKKRRAPNYKGPNKYLYPAGSTITLYPTQDLSEYKEWVLAEGELDALTLESQDIPALTAGGVTSFKPKFVKYFKDKTVFICFDTDKSGKDASEKVAQILLSVTSEVFIVSLPEEESCKDIGDYFKLGHTKEEFLELLINAKKVEKQEQEDDDSETETSGNIEKKPLLTNQLTYQEVENKVLAFLPNSQTALKIILAVSVSAAFDNPVMLWLLLVGVPSSGKTDVVRLVKDSDITYYLDNLTTNAFISGERSKKSEKVHDLLPLLDKKCLIIKDWTSIFSLDEKMTKKLLGDLVGIYDKEFTKFSSRRGNVSYSSAFSQLGCLTPATLNKHTNYMNMVGPRFLCYIMPTISHEEKNKSYELIFTNADRSALENDARLYTSSYLNQLTQKSVSIKPLSKEVREYLRIAAELMSNCRGIVILQSASFTNDSGEEIKYYEILDVQIEDPWRAVQQLIQLTIYLAFVVGKDEVGLEELSIIKEIVLSSMPADRAKALRVVQEHEGKVTAKELADWSERSTKTARRLLDELTALKVIEKTPGSGQLAADYTIHPFFRDFICMDTAEFLSSYSSETETPLNIATAGKEEKDESFPY